MRIIDHIPPADRRGGVITTAALHRNGFGKVAIRRAVNRGSLTRIRRGWYRLAQAQESVVSAVRGGGVMSCCSALAFHGVWVLTDHHHVRTSRHASERLHRRTCCHHRRRRAPSRAVDDVDVALDVAMDCLPDDELLIVMESVVDKGLLSLDEVGAMAAGHGRRVTRLAMRMAPAQSGTETILRLAVSALRRAVRCQVPIPGIGRVDLLADGWLILECDSQRWHLDPKAWADDRRRDRKAAAEGFRVIRLTYDDVVLHLPETIQDIMAAIGHPPGRATRRRLATLLGTA
ncbi:MAG: type IV toxin-antitoxin system AbiEi family antitoxin domain-containing protein [Acidipropionibacterium acidipropionici]|jgi:very-short-patch-repair endonuclease|nr:type IV toxin-antitoxin system AbiEi family antitoxin domain-containing protein [Acidipropionibacterium acidipropionici]ALN15512.1 hypothetical protein ASQ49_09745 [Acidipropionibacterium acidipropionici]AMS04984.1 hypothetical protein AXH35_05415 [Acidipropionibacterium acidipropionici]AOZ46465.1 hypothetical protein A8L58_06880 [Acidipropionibacterium acidipropionici]APZ08741.1 hypothetical protein BWX38_05160 [Acidipropionibacterium acidipropionici]AZP37484.1 hypothetical protein DUY81_0